MSAGTVSAASKVAIVAGASVGLGSALCAVLAARGYRVFALGREAATRQVATQVAGTRALACDLASPSDLVRAVGEVEASEGAPSVAAYLAHRLELSPFAETPPYLFEQVWRTTCFGAALFARAVLPKMRERAGGALLFAGATASVRGGARSAAFASAKFALRGLAQSLAREYWPHGVHVAHAVLDGLVWSPRTEARFSPRRDDCMDPVDVAEALAALVDQPRSAWTHEIDLRPWKEKF